MARLRHETTVAAAPREWFSGFVAELHDAVEALPFQDGRLAGEVGVRYPVSLLDGEHLTQGARYRFGDGRPDEERFDEDGRRRAGRVVDVVLDSWDRTTESSATVTGSTDRNAFTLGVDLHAVDQPRTFQVTGTITGVRNPPPPADGPPGTRQAPPLSRPQRPVRCELAVDFDRWWADATRTGTGPAPAPVVATVLHKLVTVRIAVTVRPANPGSWLVTVRTKITGRSWTRPAAALGLLVGRRRLARGHREAIDAMTKTWNTEIPKLMSRDLTGPSGESIWNLLTSLELEPSDRQQR